MAGWHCDTEGCERTFKHQQYGAAVCDVCKMRAEVADAERERDELWELAAEVAEGAWDTAQRRTGEARKERDEARKERDEAR
ncbi:MAG TPA: hypothetical protein VLB27_11975, partial [candidate division Zixibacteria bacterium]|nr:hypothetical protein [candidate division Zixibacteria bacterium]